MLATLTVAGSSLLLVPGGRAGAASPELTQDSSVSMSAEPMLAGSFRIGSWAAIRVLLENHGPAVDGELRLTSTTTGSSTYAILIELAPGARQEHVLYGKTGAFGSRFRVTLVSGSSELARRNVPIQASDSATRAIFIVAERPEVLVGAVRDAATNEGTLEPAIVSVSPRDLPPRGEPWASIDVVVWRDADSTSLDTGQREALRTWLVSGGHLVVVAGSSGFAALAGFPADLLPYWPSTVIDVPASDIEAMLGSAPLGGASTSALAGTLERGRELGRSGNSVIAARSTYGQGTVTLLGLDPTEPAFAASPASDTLWRLVLATRSSGANVLDTENDAFLAESLSNLPTIQLPPIEHLLVLMLVYVVAIGPLNYIVLRRRDRREWAWLTMPLTIVVFAVALYAFGVATRGANVVINEVAIVNGATDADRGMARVHVGIYSPGRGNFDVRIGGGALPSAAAGNRFSGREERPIDVILGDPATLRDYSVGFGTVRAFSADAAVGAPLVHATLELVGGNIAGSVTNASERHLEDVSVVFASAAQVIGDLAPGESRPVELGTGRANASLEGMSDRLFPRITSADADADEVRQNATRRAVVEYLGGGWNNRFGAASDAVLGSGPVVLAWESGSTLAIDVGTPSEHTGERLFVLRAKADISGPVVFGRGLILSSTLEVDSLDGGQNGRSTWVLNRGTVTAEFRPVGVESSFAVSGLFFRLGTETLPSPTGAGDEILPLPADEQPDSEEPLTSNPRPNEGSPEVPRVQLFDRLAGTWVEFEPVALQRTYRVPDPEHYVDQTGVIRVRFVSRSLDSYAYFSFAPRIEGVVE